MATRRSATSPRTAAEAHSEHRRNSPAWRFAMGPFLGLRQRPRMAKGHAGYLLPSNRYAPIAVV
jgi:hypothetical protein